VDSSKQQEFIQSLRNLLEGYTPVCDVKAESMTIPEMLRITHQAHEQQQAQQLRCRLNEQIDAPTFTPSYKKYNNKPQ